MLKSAKIALFSIWLIFTGVFFSDFGCVKRSKSKVECHVGSIIVEQFDILNLECRAGASGEIVAIFAGGTHEYDLLRLA